jgi:2-methylcitrate dehydratase PrpD
MFTDQFSRHLHSLTLENAPSDVIERTKHCVLDWLGVAIAGSVEPATTLLVNYISTQGGLTQATAIGRGKKYSLLQSVLINGFAGHMLDYDDVHLSMWGHPSATILPVALALAELNKISGMDFLEAVAVGIEANCCLGSIMTESHYRAGWHATATLGGFGAAASAAKILGLNPDCWPNAFGFVSAQASGLQALFGTDAKPYQVGKASANGLEAALLAANGLQSQPDIFERAGGGGEMFSGADISREPVDMGVYNIRTVLFKYHASCYGTQAAIESTVRLRENFNVTASSFERLDVYVPSRYLRICNITEPKTAVEMKFSLNFTCALALLGRTTSAIEAFNDNVLRDPAVLAVARKITVYGDDTLPDAGARVVSFEKKNNKIIKQYSCVDVGKPEGNIQRQWERLRNKFLTLSIPVIGEGRAQRLVTMVSELESETNMGNLAGFASPEIH